MVADSRLRYKYEHEGKDSYTSTQVTGILFRYIHALPAQISPGLRYLGLNEFVNLTISEGIADTIVQIDHTQLRREGDVSLNHAASLRSVGCCAAWHEARTRIGMADQYTSYHWKPGQHLESALDLLTFEMQTTYHLCQRHSLPIPST